MPWLTVSVRRVENAWLNGSYLGQDGLAVLVRNVLEGHLSALVLVELELGVLGVGDLVQRDYCPSVQRHEMGDWGMHSSPQRRFS